MQLCHLFSLSSLAGYSLYSHLDSRSKSALRCTSKSYKKQMNALKHNEEIAENFVRQVLENYKITHSSLPLDQLHRLIFYPQKVIGLGESHIDNSHRKCNGQLINSLFTRSYIIRVECHRNDRDLVLTGTTGQLQYVEAPIRARAKSWDCAHVVTYELLYHTMFYVRFTQTIFNIFDSFREDSLKRFAIIIRSSFLKDEFQPIFKDSFSKYNQIRNPSLTDRMDTALQLAEKALDALDKRMKVIDDKFISECEQRDQHLENSLLRDLSQKRSSIFVSGSKHLKSLLKKDKTASLFTKMGIPLLFITPKSTEITRSQSFLLVLVERLKQIGRITPEQLDSIKNLICDLNPSSLDCDTNHFGAWQYICEQSIRLYLHFKRTGEL
jgi:hypothetical protein